MGMEPRLSATTSQSESNLQIHDRLSPAIISSCTMGTPETVIDAIPKDVHFVQYYACMHDDLDLFFSHLPKPRRSALRAFADLAEDRGAAEKNATAFADALRTRYKGREIIAFSSFIPEIMPPGELSPKAVAAIRFLVMTAAKLKSDHRPFVVEFVGGSRTLGLTKRDVQVENWTETNFRVGILPSARLQDSIRELVRRLEPVALEAEKRNIILALQLEPGPFFLMNGPEALGFFCDELNSNASQSWKNTIGLNLDVAHWAFLSKNPFPGSQSLDLDWLNRNERVLNRIVHAHVCDQSIGHLADLHLEALHEEPDFSPWLELIARRLMTKPDPDSGVLPYSGFVSIEHEACKSPEQIRYSFDILCEWIQKINTSPR